jgi:iron complex transport system ATP-binding protein
MQSNSNILEASDVSVMAADHEILSSVSVSLMQGSRTAILGLNGVGKTTLLRVLSGALQPTRGQVSLLSRPLQQFSSRERAQNLAYVAQDALAPFPFTVRETVMMGRHPWQSGYFFLESDLERVDAIILRVGLADLSKRLVNTLSGGERQRVMLARALAQDTPLILLDEPLNHLDIRHRAFVLDVLREENQKRGVTIVAVMHELRETWENFDQVVLMQDRRVAAAGATRDFLTPHWIKQVFDVDPHRVGMDKAWH